MSRTFSKKVVSAKIDPKRLFSVQKRAMHVEQEDYNKLHEIAYDLGYDKKKESIKSPDSSSSSSTKMNRSARRKAAQQSLSVGVATIKSPEVSQEPLLTEVSPSSSSSLEMEESNEVTLEDLSSSAEVTVEDEEVPSKKEEIKIPPAEKLLSDGSDAPIDNGSGGYMWTNSQRRPKVVDNIEKDCRALFNVGDENVSGSIVHIWFPPKNYDQKEIVYIPKAQTTIACRIVAVLGSKEILNFGALQGDTEASCELLFNANEARRMDFGVASSIDITLNNGRSGRIKVLPTSSRFTNIDKNPSKRFIVVVDYLVNNDTLVNEFHNSMKLAAGGDIEKEKLINEKMGGIITDVDSVVAEANSKS